MCSLSMVKIDFFRHFYDNITMKKREPEAAGFWHRVKELLLKDQSKTIPGLCAACGYNVQGFRNCVTKGSEPGVIRARKIAEYLNTSLEYLVTGNKEDARLELKKLRDKLARIESICKE